MSYTAPKETYSGSVYGVTLGTGDKAVTFGGENVLTFHGFEGKTPNKPVIAHEIQDVAPSDWPDIPDLSQEIGVWAHLRGA